MHKSRFAGGGGGGGIGFALVPAALWLNIDELRENELIKEDGAKVGGRERVRGEVSSCTQLLASPPLPPPPPDARMQPVSRRSGATQVAQVEPGGIA